MMEEFSEVRSGSKVYWRRGHTDLTEPEKEGWTKKIEKKNTLRSSKNIHAP